VRPHLMTNRGHSGRPSIEPNELTDIALRLREREALGPRQRYRLVGVGLSNFQEPEYDAAQPVLFE